jgi:hypothetical protein
MQNSAVNQVTEKNLPVADFAAGLGVSPLGSMRG